MPPIQTTVLGILERDGEYLLQRLTDPGEGAFYRPIGGGIEFGEESGAALEREFREELDVEITAGPTLGTIENRFSWDGEPDHELVVLRAAEFADESLYERETFSGVDNGGAVEYDAGWFDLESVQDGPEPLYPEGLVTLLDGDGDGAGHVAEP
ncbi:NUDIX hydrolase [Haloarchaeobius iranensis]|uniref:ADP-ribose pyrophosphatase YjhB, NUDIX family n=1 Tax=Haloarchaeobius iranensis TaxID=996166 RepID=A0A1H0AMM4_9EURY|nr:NUDIX domain-containing protein [Haloarchaeobius iranensis]SDN34780.1 ADP-ribose pyrophosphatase YjhB, NUDIX family [Haloarchaeobius iranensis]